MIKNIHSTFRTFTCLTALSLSHTIKAEDDTPVEAVEVGTPFSFGAHEFRWEKDANQNKIIDHGEVSHRAMGAKGWKLLEDESLYKSTILARRLILQDSQPGVSYKNVPGRDLTAHVHYPKGWKASDRRPVIIWFHGGGFRPHIFPLCLESMQQFLTKHGFLPVASSNTSLNKQWQGKKTDFRGFDSYQILCEGRPAKVICPKKALPGAPWEWRGSFWGMKANPNTEMTVIADVKLLEAGYHIVIAGPGVALGHPSGMTNMDAIYSTLTEKYSLSKKPVLMGLSRECLSVYRWASTNPKKVAAIYIDGGVCSLKSWPGGRLVAGSDAKGTGSAIQWQLAKDLYGFKSDDEALTYKLNPIDLLEPLAKAGVPLLHVAGLADTVVPYDENTAVLAARYKKLGGSINVITVEGIGHVHGLKNPAPILEFMHWHTK